MNKKILSFIATISMSLVTPFAISCSKPKTFSYVDSKFGNEFKYYFNQALKREKEDDKYKFNFYFEGKDKNGEVIKAWNGKDRKYQIGSQSKMFAGLIAQKMLQENKIKRTDKINDMFPGSGSISVKIKEMFSNLHNKNDEYDKNLTFEHIISHKSEMMSYIPIEAKDANGKTKHLHDYIAEIAKEKGTTASEMPGWMILYAQARFLNKYYKDKDWSSESIVDLHVRLNKTKDLRYENGDLRTIDWNNINYTNWGAIFISIIAERVYQKTWPQILKEYIFNPLNMKNSSFDNSDTVGYYDDVKDEMPSKFYTAAGGIVSTMSDMREFINAIYNEDTKLLSKAQWAIWKQKSYALKTQQENTSTGEQLFYQGIFSQKNMEYPLLPKNIVLRPNPKYIGHGGNVLGFNSYSSYDEDTGFIALTSINNGIESKTKLLKLKEDPTKTISNVNFNFYGLELMRKIKDGK